MAGSAVPKVTIVIPTWKRTDFLQKCLQSIAQQTVTDFEVIVVSNGAGKETARMAETVGHAVIDLPANLGFAAGVNAGIAYGKSPYVLVLNDDVELDPAWLSVAVTFLDEHPESFYCCGKIHQPGGRLLDNAGDALSLGGSAWRLGFGRPDTAAFDLPRPVWAVSGTATLFRRAVFEKIGMFDEDFFAYLEDIDLSLRAARAGLQGHYLPEATSCHWGGATAGGPESAMTIRLLTRNQLLLLLKHFPLGLLLRLSPRIVWAQILWSMLAVRKRRFGAYLGALVEFLLLLPSVIRRRTAWTAGESEAFLARLKASEQEIYADVTAAARPQQDTFWRAYFALFPVQVKPKAANRDLRTAL